MENKSCQLCDAQHHFTEHLKYDELKRSLAERDVQFKDCVTKYEYILKDCVTLARDIGEIQSRLFEQEIKNRKLCAELESISTGGWFGFRKC